METITEKPEELVRLYDENAGLWKIVKKDRGILRSLEIVEDALIKLGLSKNAARVYIYLARAGEKKASEISEALSLHRTETYRILRDLEKKGLISSVFEKPLKFIAVPFEKAISILIEIKKLKIKLLEKEKEKLVDVWASLPTPKIEHEKKEVFQILEGEDQIDLKASEILERTEQELCLFVNEEDLARFYHSGFLDSVEKIVKKKVSVKILTEKTERAMFFIKEMKIPVGNYSFANVDGKLPCFIISDNEEMLLLIKKEDGQGADGNRRRKLKTAALWTNYEGFITTLKILFNQLWSSKMK